MSTWRTTKGYTIIRKDRGEMKGIAKKIVSVILAVALVVTGFNYVPGPETVKAETSAYTSAYTQIEAENPPKSFGDGIKPEDNQVDGASCGMNIGGIKDGYWVGGYGLDFGDNGASQVTFRYSRIASNSGTIEFRLEKSDGSPGDLIAKSELEQTGSKWSDWKIITVPTDKLLGKQKIYVVFRASAGNANENVCNFDWFRFTEATDENQGYIYVKSQKIGKYVQLKSGTNDNQLVANGDKRSDWERTAIIQNDDGTVSFKSLETGLYWCCDEYNGNIISAKSSKIDDWERFSIEKMPPNYKDSNNQSNENYVAIKAVHAGKYITVDTSANNSLKATADSASHNEVFHFESLDGSWFVPRGTEENGFAVRDAFTTIKAASYNETRGTVNNDGFNGFNSGEPFNGTDKYNVGSVDNGDWAAYNNVLFGGKTPKAFTITYTSNSSCGGWLEVYLDDMSGSPIGKITLPHTCASEWKNYRTIEGDISVSGNITGKHTVYIKANTDGNSHLANIADFHFLEKRTSKSAYKKIEAEGYDGNNIAEKKTSDDKEKYLVSGTGYLGNTKSDGWARYENIYFSADTNYLTLKYAVKGSNSRGTINVKIDYDTTVASIHLDATAAKDWYGYVQKQFKLTTKIAAGTTHEVRLEFVPDTDASGIDYVCNLDWFRFDTEVAQYEKSAFEDTIIGDSIRLLATACDDQLGDLDFTNPSTLQHTVANTMTAYKIHFNRKTSKIHFYYASRATNAGGTVDIYLDDENGEKLKSVTLQPKKKEEDDWAHYYESSDDIEILAGNHTLYFKYVPGKNKFNSSVTNNYVANIDYFYFDYAPETAVDTNHEAENAHAYIKGSSTSEIKPEESGNFSNNKAIGGLNTWPNDGRAYMTTYVKVAKAGNYKLKIFYATANSKTTNIDYRINEWCEDWSSSTWEKRLQAKSTGSYDSVSSAETTVTLNKGINKIDITGAVNEYYSDDTSWQYINLDKFTLERIVESTNNLALDKPVETSGDSTDTDMSPEEGVDGYSDSRWQSSTGSGEKTYMIDLQGMYEIEKVRILFQKAYATDFELQVSRDNKVWTTVKIEGNWKPSINDTTKLEWKVGYNPEKCLGKARYIRLRAKALKDASLGLSIWEFEVYGNKVSAELSNVALKKTNDASTIASANPKENAVDGDESTRWAASGENEWYYVNLGKEYTLDSIDIKFERAYAKKFEIQTSKNGKDWTTVQTVDWSDLGNLSDNDYNGRRFGYSVHLRDRTVTASYVKIKLIEREPNNWSMSIWELEVWGKDATKADYWTDVKNKTYGIYSVSGLSNATENGNIKSSLVQGDVLASGDTCTIIYEENKDIYFYVNPRNISLSFDKDKICWSGWKGESNEYESNSGWGANYNASLAQFVKTQQSTVQYKLPDAKTFNKLLNGGDSYTTEIGCQIYGTTNGVSDLGVEEKSPKFSITIKLKVLKSKGILIQDTISENGCLTVQNADSSATYQWQKSTDGTEWIDVSDKRNDLEIVKEKGTKVNVANDMGGGKYYRVKKTPDGEWSYSYQVPYYSNVRNGDFEFPAMFAPGESGATFPFNPTGDEQQYPNGYSGLVWKTTGPGWNNMTGHDIEIVNGRRLKTDQSSQETAFSVTLEEMYPNLLYGKNGDQFAELNCENIGALYQDILTTPGSQCSWELDHAGRWNQNSMYVVAMSAKQAENYTTSDQIAKIVDKARQMGVQANQKGSPGTVITLDEENKVTATVWKVTSPGETTTKGEWGHHRGVYTVPEDNVDINYLTRYFFVSEDGASNDGGANKNPTVGNLLDNISFEMKMDYSIEYYVEDETNPKHTTKGTVQPYDTVNILNSIPNYNLTEYTLYKATMNGRNYYVNADRIMTVAAQNNNLKLYYKKQTVSINHKVEGMGKIPEGYEVKITVKNSKGKVISERTLRETDYTEVDKVSDTDVEGYFATFHFSGSDYHLTDGETLSITETLVPLYLQDGYYLEKTTISNGSTHSYTATRSDLDKEQLIYEGTFDYQLSSDNTVNITNVYQPTNVITVSKKVAGNMAETDKYFDFTVDLTYDNAATPALACDSKITYNGNGKYSFKLKDGESTYITVIDGYTALVKETSYVEEYYKTTWTVSGVGITEKKYDKAFGFITDKITENVTVDFLNTNIFNGEVEVQGFQMNSNKNVGGVSEFSPSFRVVSRACRDLIGSDGMRHKVKTRGTIYALDSELNHDYKQLTLDNADNENCGYIHKLDANETGIYKGYTTRRDDDIYYTYYAVTFIMKDYSFNSLQADMAFRAYAILDNDEVVYGEKVYAVNMYEIAQNLYENRKMGTLAGHNYLYNNILNVVTMNKNRVEITKSVRDALGVTSPSSPNYQIVSNFNKDVNDYVYCQNGYLYSERDTVPFTTKRTDAGKLLELLNKAQTANYDSIFAWIETETPIRRNGKGFYKRVPYEWDNSIYGGK